MRKLFYTLFTFLYINVCFSDIYYVDSTDKNSYIDRQISFIMEKIAKNNDLSNVIEFLPGHYYLNKKIEIELSPKHSIQLRGHGVGATTLHWKRDSIDQGITVHFKSTGPLTGHKGSICVQDMSLINDSYVKDAVAISLINHSEIPGGAETPTKNIKDIGISGYTSDSFWKYGIVLDGCTFTNIDRLTFHGNNFRKGNAILLKGYNKFYKR